MKSRYRVVVREGEESFRYKLNELYNEGFEVKFFQYHYSPWRDTLHPPEERFVALMELREEKDQR